jgi:diguanylate cyclase (GGDEF)-like protein
MLSRRSRTEQQLEALLQDVDDGIVLVRDGRVRLASPGAARLFASQHDAVALCEAAGSAPEGRLVVERDCTTADGEHRRVRVTAVDRRRDRSIKGFVVTCRDLTEERRLHARVAHQAMHDPLTGLANRALFANRLELALRHRRRSGTEVTVLFLDLDRFRPVNDRLGTEAGDRVLREVAIRLRQTVRDTDTVARLGGDELAIVAADAGTEADILDFAHRLVAAVEEPVVLGEAVVELGVSIGIATTDGSETADDVLRRAELAMQAAKENGSRVQSANLAPSPPR